MANGLGPIGNLLGKVDSNGALVVSLSGSFTGQLLGEVSATVPAYSFAGDTNTGYGATAADTLGLFAGGTTARLSVSSTAVTSTVGMKVTGTGTFTGLGLELTGDTNPVIRAYDRTGSSYLPMIYDASSHEFQASGGGGIRLTVSGSAVTSTVPYRSAAATDLDLQPGTSGGTVIKTPDGTTRWSFNTSGNIVGVDGQTFGWSDVSLSRGAADVLQLAQDDNFSLVRGYVQGFEQTAPAAPAADGYRIFAQDNGAGKTQLMVIFASGASQQLAIQP